MTDGPPGYTSPLYVRPSVVSSSPAFTGAYVSPLPLAFVVSFCLLMERIASLIAHGIPLITIQAGIFFPRHFFVFVHTFTHGRKFRLKTHDYYV